tara:strand:+ start:2497 stop:2724 length:228 start_codon:yes stop_codon:yes gene_type:complete
MDEYPFYVINSLTHAVLAGAEFKEDAIEMAKDLPPGYIVKVFSRAYCIRQGIDLSDSNWSNGRGDDIRVWPQEWG